MNIAEKTLYITDLDGTLLDNRGNLPKEAAKTINSLIKEGLLFTYATARSFATASVVTKGLELNIPVILNNGVFLKSPGTGEIIEASLMDTELLRPVSSAVERAGIPALVFSVIGGEERVSWIEGTENDGIRSYLSARPGDKRLRPVKSYSDLFEGNIMQFTIISNEARAGAFLKICDQTDYCHYSLMRDTYNPDEWWLEIYRRDANKASAAKRLMEILGAEKLVAFGDNMNDMPVFELSDECYAVENAVPKLKAAATGVIGSNEDYGVAKWLLENGAGKSF